MLIQYTTQCCATSEEVITTALYIASIGFTSRASWCTQCQPTPPPKKHEISQNFVCIIKGTSGNVQHTQHSLSGSFQSSYLADSKILGGRVDRDEYNISINNSLCNISGKEEILASHLLYHLKQTRLQIQNGFKAINRNCNSSVWWNSEWLEVALFMPGQSNSHIIMPPYCSFNTRERYREPQPACIGTMVHLSCSNNRLTQTCMTAKLSNPKYHVINISSAITPLQYCGCSYQHARSHLIASLEASINLCSCKTTTHWAKFFVI